MPQQRHAGKDQTILEARTAIYKAAKDGMPNRWNGRAVRNCAPISTVWLNPDNRTELPPEPVLVTA